MTFIKSLLLPTNIIRLSSIKSTRRNLKSCLSINYSQPAETCDTTPTSSYVGDERSRQYGDIIPVIGLEVHAQLNTKAKLFSQGDNSGLAAPNTGLDLLDVALPGTLPKLNKKALEVAILTSLGLNCTIQDEIHFDRKNYFYTDMPAGFQITQYNKPLAKNGYIDFIAKTYHRSVIAHSQLYDIVKYLYFSDRTAQDDIEPYIMRSRIKQIQLEQDSAKTLNQTSRDGQQESFSLVDYNRSGSCLVEIVFEPDLMNHHEASSLIKELISILKKLDACDCELQNGSLRVDANISIRSINGQDVIDSKRVELKNLNSPRFINRAISYEIQRQAKLIRSGEKVLQETRSFDPKSGETNPLRLKEEAVDYRYFPEPSIPPIQIDSNMIEHVRSKLPDKLPRQVRNDLIDKLNLELGLVSELVEEPGLSEYMKDIIDQNTFKNEDFNSIADFLIYTIANLKNICSDPLQPHIVVDLISQDSEFRRRLSPEKMGSIIKMILDDEINFATGFELIKYILINNDSSQPKSLVDKFGWHQISDKAEVGEHVADLVIRMKKTSKKYATRGEKQHLRLMLTKLCELTSNRISIKVAIECINASLKPPLEGK